jgi:hypothetical protein
MDPGMALADISILFSHDMKMSAVVAATSNDGGESWGNIRSIKTDDGSPGTNGFNDKESVTADPTKPGVAYAVWDRVAPDNGVQPTWFSRTTNGGRTWQPARIILPSQGPGTGTIGNQIVVDRGALIDVFDVALRHFSTRTLCRRIHGKKRCHTVRKVVPNRFDTFIADARSTDGGRSWSTYHIIARERSVGIRDNTGQYVRTGGGLPAVAIGPRRGKLFVVWQDARFTGGALDQVVIASSTDGGSHWTRPRPVYRRPVAGFTPSVAVDVRGEVGVSFYDLRHDSGQPDTLRTDYWLTISSDGGRHFNRETHLGGPFNLRSAPNAGGFFLGDYQGLAAAGNVFHAFFVKVNDATPDNATDVFALAIVTRKPA